MKVLMIEPQKEPYETEIGNSLKDMQKVVNGYIQAIYPYSEPVALICNEEAKLNGLPLNRALYDENGEMYDIVSGTFFICGVGEENFTSIAPDDLEKFKEEFQSPEIFQHINEKICAVKIDSLNEQKEEIDIDER